MAKRKLSDEAEEKDVATGDKKTRHRSSLEGFKKILVEGQQENENGIFPLALSPESELDLTKMVELLSSHQEKLKEKLGQHGALLFRGFSLETADDFLKFLDPFKFQYGNYIGGGGPRSVVLGPIHNSTETPADSKIPFHHELAYLTKNPGKLIFFCHTPAKEDGETPILNSNRLYKKILTQNKSFVDKVKEKKIIYTRVLADKSKCDHKFQRSWQEIFSTTDKKVAEQRALETGTESIEWLEDNSMVVVSKALDGIVTDPRIKSETWFNSVVLLHPATQDKAKNAPWKVTYGDGSQIDDADVLGAQKMMDENAVSFKWEKGDVLLVDNRLALHARNRFTPPRLILAAIAD